MAMLMSSMLRSGQLKSWAHIFNNMFESVHLYVAGRRLYVNGSLTSLPTSLNAHGIVVVLCHSRHDKVRIFYVIVISLMLFRTFLYFNVIPDTVDP